MADTITVALRKALRTKLKTLCSDVSYRVARGGHSGPFIIFSLSQVLDDDAVWPSTVYVDVLDRGQDTTGVETLADNIWMALDHYFYLVDGLGFTVYQQSRAEIDEENESLNHLRLNFTLRLYK